MCFKTTLIKLSLVLKVKMNFVILIYYLGKSRKSLRGKALNSVVQRTYPLCQFPYNTPITDIYRYSFNHRFVTINPGKILVGKSCYQATILFIDLPNHPSYGWEEFYALSLRNRVFYFFTVVHFFYLPDKY